MTIDVRAGVRGTVRGRMQHYGWVLDLQGASGGGLVNEDARGCIIAKISALCRVDRERNERGDEPLDYVERAERTVLLGGEAVEWRIEGEADVVYFLAEDGGDVAE